MSDAIREMPTEPTSIAARTAFLVVPCYNEAARLPADAFRAFASQVSFPLRVLFVNDGSTDNTLDVLNALKDADPIHFSVLDLANNGGKAEAVRQGFLHVLRGQKTESENPAYLGYMDADLATPLSALGELRQALEDKPSLRMAMGSRIRLLGREIKRRAIRHYLGRGFATAASLLLRLPVYDTQCGAKLFRVGPWLGDLFAESFRTRWIFDVEILARMVLQARRGEAPPVDRIVYEHPLREWRDVAGSKVRPRDFLKALWEFALIYRHYFFRRSARLFATEASPSSIPSALQESNSPC